jgi:hypothetical protein
VRPSTLLACLLLATALAAGGARPGWAGEGPALGPANAPAEETVPPDVDALLARLGSPARPDVARDLLAHPATRDAGVANRVANELSAAGGIAGVEGLLALAGHRDFRVRTWVLKLVRDLGIRASRGADGVRHCLDAPDAEVRRRACWALEVVGDASDVPVLLEIASRSDASASPEDRALARAALATVRRLADLDSRFTSLARVKAWWEANRDRMRLELTDALDAIESRSGSLDPDLAHALLCRRLWMDPGSVVERLHAWLVSSDPALRIEACRVVERMRLADVSAAIESALAFETDDQALLALGGAARSVHATIPPLTQARLDRVARSVAAAGASAVTAEAAPAEPQPAGSSAERR